jgi:predicted aspartyl protease
LLPALIKGQRVDWLADTGANFSMISDAEATRLGLPFAIRRGGWPTSQAGAPELESRSCRE